MVGDTPSSPACVGRHWPEYARDPGQPRPAAAPLCRWAEAHVALAAASRGLLIVVAREASRPGPCRLSLADLATLSGTSRNTCRRHLDRLMAAGLVMMKPWLDPDSRCVAALGYEFRLIPDEDARLAALDHGFVAERSIMTDPASLSRGLP